MPVALSDCGQTSSSFDIGWLDKDTPQVMLHLVHSACR